MLLICVEKTWLKSFGDLADLFVIHEHLGEYVGLLASEASVSFPFVEAKLARRKVAENENAFLSAQLPAAVISGIFNLTSAELGERGFPVANKKA